MSAPTFSLGRQAGADGRFHRPESTFREQVEPGGRFPPEAGRYHLYVSHACPWAHRTVIARRLKGLEHAISLSLVDPIRDLRGWAFSGGPYTDPVNGFAFLSEAYEATDPAFRGRISVPVLWDRTTGCIVNNESSEILRMLDGAFGDLADDRVSLYPESLRDEIDALNAHIYATVNNGVYAAGFASTQPAYEDAYAALFTTLDELEERLSTRRYLVGDAPTEADWRLFTTLVRFDTVYHGHFKCNRQRLVEFPALWGYTRDLFAQPGVADTVDLDQIKSHYYGTHPMVNPSGIVPVGPRIDFTAPHDRASLG
ncbi:MAG: glutathione S-transferase family protein [Solirubrobacterales bacterium]|nr:glutathione S-transferase family protein [Solirubrobacterales bacterium]